MCRGEPGDLGSLHTSSWNEVPLSSDGKEHRLRHMGACSAPPEQPTPMRSAWKGWGGGWSRGQGYSTCQSPDFPGRPEVPTSTPVEEASSCNWAATDGSEGR